MTIGGAVGEQGGEALSRAVRGAGRHLRFLVADSRYRRRPSDIVRCVVAAVLLLVFALVTRSGSRLESSLVDFLVSLPSWLRGIFQLLYSVGTFAVLVAVLVVAVWPRRWRLMVSVALAAAVSAVLVVLLHTWLDSGASAAASVAHLRSFPLRRLAVTVAVVLSLRHAVVRPLRLLLDVAVVLTVLGALLYPVGMPLDVAAGFLVGWGSAAVTALLLGSPAGQPTAAEVVEALRELGVVVGEVELSEQQQWGDVRYRARAADGEWLDVVVFGRDADDAQLLAKTWRTIWYRDTGPTVTFSRQHRVEQLAFILLFARRSGATVPDVVTAGLGRASGSAVLVTRPAPGVPLAQLDPAQVGDELLADLWRSVGALRAARIAHGALDADRIVVDGQRAVLVDFTKASSSAPPVRLDADLANLLVTLATIVGPERAIDSLQASLGSDAVRSSVAVLQPAAVSSDLRRRVEDLKDVLAGLREIATDRTGAELPAPAELRRVSIGDIVVLALTFVGVSLILSMFADIDWDEFWTALREATWGWVLVGAVLSVLPAFTDALATLGGLGTQLPLGPLTMLNIGSKFINVAVPSSVGQAAVSIRFAQKMGIEAGAAISGGMVIGFSGFLIQALVLGTGLLVGVVELDLDLSFDAERGGLWLFAALGVGVSIVLAVRSSIRLRAWFDRIVRPQITEFRSGLRAIVDEPRRLVLLFVGNLGSQFLYGAVMYACLLAYGGGGDDFFLALVANTAATLLGGLVPVPGGIGIWEGIATATLTAGGVDVSIATVAVLTHRMLTFYLPPAYGYLGFVWLRKHDYL